MTTGWTDAPGRTRAPAAVRGPTESRFTDALCGPDGTGDPSVLMPVLQVYPDALSAPMPDAMVPLPPLDPAAILAAARQAAVPPTPAQARVAAQRVATDRPAQPGRYGRNQTQPAQARPPQRPRQAPSAWGNLEPHSAVAPHLQGPRQAGTNQLPTPSAPTSGSSAWTRTMSPAEVAGFLRTTFAGITHGPTATTQQFQPAPHAPAPPLPRSRQQRRNKGSSIWAVLVFLIIIAFASGIAQQIINAISGLFNR